MISLLNNKMKKIVLTISFLLAFNRLMLAQPGFDDDVNDVPVDGGVSILVLGAAAYSLRKIHQKNKIMNQ